MIGQKLPEEAEEDDDDADDELLRSIWKAKKKRKAERAQIKAVLLGFLSFAITPFESFPFPLYTQTTHPPQKNRN